MKLIIWLIKLWLIFAIIWLSAKRIDIHAGFFRQSVWVYLFIYLPSAVSLESGLKYLIEKLFKK